MNFKENVFLIVFLSGFCWSGVCWSIMAQEKPSQLFKESFSNDIPRVTHFNINNISTPIYQDGRADREGNNSAFEFPKGSGKYCVYESGFIFGGKEGGGQIKFGGSEYFSSMVPGRIMEDGTSQALNDPLNRIFRVRPDWENGSLFSELQDNEFERNENAIREQYRLDWMEWPWQYGAPYLDADGDGIYIPDPDGNGTYNIGEDIPGLPGADQTIWFAANHTDPEIAYQFYGSPPTDFEMQVTIWGYMSGSSLGNMIFKKIHLINKSEFDYTDFYCGIWSDPDVGSAGDDFVGCDTLLDLGYAYNAYQVDSEYGDSPPAVGFSFLDVSETDSEETNKMSSFYYFRNDPMEPWHDPGDPYTEGVLYFYNALQGKISSTGEYFPIPEEIGGGYTNYPLSGDPVTGSGYVDGIISGPGDTRFIMSTGPFNIPKGESAEITFMQIAAGGSAGVGNLESIYLLRTFTLMAHKSYEGYLCCNLTMPVTNAIVSSGAESIKIKWGSESELYSGSGFEFQGYNIYQLPAPNSPLADGIKIRTFDKIDGVKVILQGFFEKGVFVNKIIQRGNDTGIANELVIVKDYIHEANLVPGTEYHYAITSYSYNPEAWGLNMSYESSPNYITVTMGTNAGADIEKINVFPNPYYGANPNELTRYQRYVTFSHLPEQATIKIFNLAGQLVKTIYKTELGQFQRWDLMNEFNILVPGGIYIAYIEMPTLGETKILKLAIIPEKIIPDWY
ncbi:MAG: T9SS type A sorting domain-containing protein [Bacteroidetes bacterium]|nr:T9SS type A sorting domain-containing protein [Bacteroidota bacterium]